jgi:hypothetical protein
MTVMINAPRALAVIRGRVGIVAMGHQCLSKRLPSVEMRQRLMLPFCHLLLAFQLIPLLI